MEESLSTYAETPSEDFKLLFNIPLAQNCSFHLSGELTPVMGMALEAV